MSGLRYGVFAVMAGVLLGCGGNSAPSSGMATPPMGTAAATTPVTVMLSSTANDHLSTFNLSFTSLTLTSQSGKTVSVLAKAQNAEFMHLNGAAESLLTVDLPQDVYTSASATIGAANFGCVMLDSSAAILSGSYAYGATPAGNVTVNLPQPITIADAHVGLLLNLLVSQSAVFSTCISGVGQSYTIQPTFDLTVMAFAAQPSNVQNGRETNLEGLIASVSPDASSFDVSAADGPAWSITTNGSTVFQGVADFSALVAGLPVDMDATIQADGSLLATRVAVQDTSTANLTVWRGPLLFVSNAVPALDTLPGEVQGQLFARMNGSNTASAGAGGTAPAEVATALGAWTLDFANAAFQTSPQYTNLQTLPFHPSFNAANMVAGQNVYISTYAADFPNSPNYVPASTVTLMPQTINGTIGAVSAQGGFTIYTVTLAGYDLLSSLANQPGQTTLLQNPGSVVVYTNGATQMLNTNPLTAGKVARFNGLVFNDNGTLRMDCTEVMDGVAP
jgi:hypothetical protein